MKKFFIILCSIFICTSAIAETSAYRTKNLPQGTFKKKRNGIIVQYDQKGKKIGEYKLGTGTYTKIK